jgi:transposase
MVEAILWIDRTGAPWRDLPEEKFGSWQSVATRFYRWVEDGVWDHVLAELQRQADASGELDWDLHHVDGTSIRAHQHAAGAKKGEDLSIQQRLNKIRKRS